LGTVMLRVLDQLRPSLAGEDGGGQTDVATGAVFQVEFLAALVFGGDRINGADRGLGQGQTTAKAEKQPDQNQERSPEATTGGALGHKSAGNAGMRQPGDGRQFGLNQFNVFLWSQLDREAGS
jgi:hypothetical protein